MSSPVFASFSASPKDRAADLVWSYSADFSANKIAYLCVNYSDTDIKDTSVTTATQSIIPVFDSETGRPILSYTLNNLTNGKEYIISLELTKKDQHVVNSDSVKVRTASVPSKPYFSLVQPSTGTFRINLKTAEENTPTKLSAFDGYSELKGVYITYNDGTKIQTTLFDTSNNRGLNLYRDNLEIQDLSNGDYEVNVKTVNEQGMSVLSDRSQISILSLPTAPRNLTAVPTMLVDPSFDLASVSMSLSWNAPSTLGDPSLNGYTVSRKELPNGAFSQIASISVSDASVNLPFTYVDNNGLVGGKIYRYSVGALNVNVNASNPARSVESDDVTAKDVPVITAVKRTSGDRNFILDISHNANGFARSDLRIDISCVDTSGNIAANLDDAELGSSTFTSLTKSGLINGNTYNFQVRVKTTSLTVGGKQKVFASPFTQLNTSMPYAALSPITNAVIYNTDNSGNGINIATPLNGRLDLSWNDPVNESYRPSNYNIVISRKLYNAPDASYTIVASIPKGQERFTNTGLINGTNYTYKLIKKQLLPEEPGKDLESAPFERNQVPFTLPSAVTDVSFTDICSNSVVIKFKTADNGGLPISNYVITLFNDSNGTSEQVQEFTPSATNSPWNYPLENLLDPSGIIGTFDLSENLNVSNKIQPGRKYRLDITPVINSSVTGNSNFYGAVASKTAFSRPTKLTTLAVRNVDASSNPLDGALNISWSLPSGFDASNATYTLKSGPITLLSNSRQTSYQDTGLTNGTNYNYTVTVKINTLESDPSDPVSGTPFGLPGVVSNLRSIVKSVSDASLCWDVPSPESLTASGILINEVRYKVIDLCNNAVVVNNIAENCATVSGLTAGVPRQYRVISGVYKNGTTYYRDGASDPSTDVATYADLVGPFGVTAYPSDKTILVDLSDNLDITGLTFKNYKFSIKPSISSTWGNSVSQSHSLFYIPNLTNGTAYDISVSLVYTTYNLVPKDIETNSVLVSATPQRAPPTPTGLSAVVNQTTVTLSWDSATAINTTHYSIYQNNELIISHIPYGQLLNGSKYTRSIIGLNAGKTYVFDVVAEQLVTGQTYVSSQKASISVVPYAPPGEVTGLSYTPNDRTINLSWTAPSDTAGAGINNNGPLKYRVKVYNPRNSYQYFSTFQDISATTYTIGTTEMTDSSNIKFSLVNDASYTIDVISYFIVGGTSSEVASNSVQLTYVTPRRLPIVPTITASALGRDGEGRNVQLQVFIDPSAVVSSSRTTFEFTRKIYDTSNNLVMSYSLVGNPVTKPAFDVSGNNTIFGRLTFGDSNASNDLALTTDPNNFLNGNRHEYTCKVTHTNWTPNYNNVQTTSAVSVIPSGRPLLEGITIEGSGNVVLTLNKNGGDINALNVVGVDASSSYVQVKTVDIESVRFTNARDNTIAQNQRAVVRLERDSWTDRVRQALGIFATSNGTAIKAQPANAFGQNPSA